MERSDPDPLDAGGWRCMRCALGASLAPACPAFGAGETCHRSSLLLREGKEQIAGLLVGLTATRPGSLEVRVVLPASAQRRRAPRHHMARSTEQRA